MIGVEARYTTIILPGSIQRIAHWMLSPDPYTITPWVPTVGNIAYGQTFDGIAGNSDSKGNIHPSSLYYWDPREWTQYAGGRKLKWILRSTIILGGTTDMNCELRVGVRKMIGGWAPPRGVDFFGETISAEWSGPPGHVSVIHPPIQTVVPEEFRDKQVFEVDAPTEAGWYALFLEYLRAPAPGGIGHLFADLSLRFSNTYATPSFGPYGFPSLPIPAIIGFGTKAQSINSNTVALTTTVSTLVGDTILVSGHFKSAGVSLVSVTDSVGNVYTLDHQAGDAVSNRSTFIARAVAKTTLPVGGTITATISASRAESKALIASKVVGVALTPVGSGEDMAAAQTTFTTSEAVATEDGMLLYGAITLDNSFNPTPTFRLGVNHIYTQSYTGPITGGTWTYWLDGQQTTPITYNGADFPGMLAAVQAALLALDNVDVGDLLFQDFGGPFNIAHTGRFSRRNRTMSIVDSTTGAGSVDFGVINQAKQDGPLLVELSDQTIDTMRAGVAHQVLQYPGSYRFEGSIAASCGYSAAVVIYRGPEV